MFKSRHFSYLTGLLFFVFSIATHAQPQEKILKKNTKKLIAPTQSKNMLLNAKIDTKTGTAH